MRVGSRILAVLLGIVGWLGSFLAWVVRSFSGWSVTHLDAVAGQAENVLYTQRGSSQQIPLDGDPISVTAGHLAEQVRIRLALQLSIRIEGTHGSFVISSRTCLFAFD